MGDPAPLPAIPLSIPEAALKMNLACIILMLSFVLLRHIYASINVIYDSGLKIKSIYGVSYRLFPCFWSLGIMLSRPCV